MNLAQHPRDVRLKSAGVGLLALQRFLRHRDSWFVWKSARARERGRLSGDREAEAHSRSAAAVGRGGGALRREGSGEFRECPWSPGGALPRVWGVVHPHQQPSATRAAYRVAASSATPSSYSASPSRRARKAPRRRARKAIARGERYLLVGFVNVTRDLPYCVADSLAATGGPDFERLIELEVADTGRPEEEKEVVSHKELRTHNLSSSEYRFNPMTKKFFPVKNDGAGYLRYFTKPINYKILTYNIRSMRSRAK